LFLTERGELYHPSMLTKMVRTWGRRVGTPMSPHKLRKSYATGLALAGVPPHLIQEYLGHESLATTQIYLESVQTPGIDAAIEAFARAGSVALEAPAPETHVNPENL
jgi:integrase